MNIYHSLALCAMSSLAAVSQAAVLFNITQVGDDVVASFSGSLNTTALFNFGNENFLAEINPFRTTVAAGASGSTSMLSLYGNNSIDFFTTDNNTSFLPDSFSGDALAIPGNYGGIYVPVGYVSGAEISGTSTFNNQSLASLSLQTGTFNFTWGSGGTADSISLNISVAAVPEPANAAALIGLTLAGGLALRRRRNR